MTTTNTKRGPAVEAPVPAMSGAVLENPNRFVASTARQEAAADASCCSPSEQASCCEPEAKASCCGAAPAGGCGCR